MFLEPVRDLPFAVRQVQRVKRMPPASRMPTHLPGRLTGHAPAQRPAHGIAAAIKQSRRQREGPQEFQTLRGGEDVLKIGLAWIGLQAGEAGYWVGVRQRLVQPRFLQLRK